MPLQDLQSIFGLVWPESLSFWARKVDFLCLCQEHSLASKSVQSLSKYRAHKFGNRRTDGRTDAWRNGRTNGRTNGHVENIMPPTASQTWWTLKNTDRRHIYGSNQIKSEKVTIAPHHHTSGALNCYSRLKIEIHNNYYKMILGSVLEGRKWGIEKVGLEPG